MKKLISLFLCITLVFVVFSGCQKIKPEPPVEEVKPPIIEDTKKPDTELEIIPAPEPEITYMSYKEFFSKERPFFPMSECGENIRFESLEYKSFKPSNHPEWFLSTKVYLEKIYNNDILIFEGLLYSRESDEHNVYAVMISKEDESIAYVVQIDFEGKVKVIFSPENHENGLLELHAYNNVVFFKYENLIYRYYAPEDVLEIIFNIPFNTCNFIFWPISTTDIRCVNYEGVKREESNTYTPEPSAGTESKNEFFFSSLTNKKYTSYYLREVDNWNIFSGFYMNYLDVDLNAKGITNFEQFKEKHIVPRGESMKSLESYGLLAFTRNSQYLKKRGEDLLKMGIEPHGISTFRYPEDDAYFYDPSGNFWGATE